MEIYLNYGCLRLSDICYAMDAKEQLERARNIRRAAKGKVTRCTKSVNVLIKAERPVGEVKDALKELKEAYAALVIKHEVYTVLK